MFPFHSSGSSPFLFSFGNQDHICPTPISDIESESKSVNGELCESFEGLFKKEDQEESTRSSLWSEKEKDLAGATKVDISQQNQNGLKCMKSTKQFYENTRGKLKLQSEPAEIQKVDYKVQSIQLQQIDQLKQSLLQRRNKLAKYREKFLSLPCYTKLPEQLLKMLEIAQKIDHYLFEKKPAKYTDNVFNIFKTLFDDEEMSTIWSTVKKLMFIAEEHYKIRIDPLKNLCMSLVGSKKQNKPQIRKQKLRKLLGEYYFNNKKTHKEHGVPEAYIEPQKTARFYPENLNLCLEIFGKKASKKFISRLQESARQKQEKLQKIEEKCQSYAPATPSSHNGLSLPDPSQLQQFCDAVSKIYSHKKVNHMYKSTLIENLRKNAPFSLEKIFFLLKYVNNEELFLEVIVKAGCTILGIIEKEKEALIQVLISRRGD